MNADLEATLSELGGDYRDLVVRMKAAYEPMPAAVADEAADTSCGRSRVRRGRIVGWSAAYLVAASLLVCTGLAVVFGRSSAVQPASNEFMLAHLKTAAAVEEMIRTQRPDGGWDNDFVTRQNIAALHGSDAPEAKVAMRRALRNLRLRGVL